MTPPQTRFHKKWIFSVGKAPLLAPSQLSTYFTLTFITGVSPMVACHVQNRIKKHEAVSKSERPSIIPFFHFQQYRRSDRLWLVY
jgi:hypothetical protein